MPAGSLRTEATELNTTEILQCNVYVGEQLRPRDVAEQAFFKPWDGLRCYWIKFLSCLIIGRNRNISAAAAAGAAGGGSAKHESRARASNYDIRLFWS